MIEEIRITSLGVIDESVLELGPGLNVVTTRDRIEPGKPPYPPEAAWTEGPEARVILRKPPTVVFALKGRLDSSAC